MDSKRVNSGVIYPVPLPGTLLRYPQPIYIGTSGTTPVTLVSQVALLGAYDATSSYMSYLTRSTVLISHGLQSSRTVGSTPLRF